MKWLNAQSYCIKIFFTTLLDNSAPLFHLLGHSIYSFNPFASLPFLHSPSVWLFTLHPVAFDSILCFFLWSWIEVWPARFHLITNKFVWLFHCSHLAFTHTHTHTHARSHIHKWQACHAACLKTQQWDNILISRHDCVVFCVRMCLAYSFVCPKVGGKFALYVQRNNSLSNLGFRNWKDRQPARYRCANYTLYTTKWRLWADLITSFT